jgi:DNA-binding transcriptional LysR family regulator
MSDRLFALRLFARVARKGSFSAAGRELNIPQSTASRTIATLEREIGVALFVRTTLRAERESCAEYCGSVWQRPLPCGRSSPGFRSS